MNLSRMRVAGVPGVDDDVRHDEVSMVLIVDCMMMIATCQCPMSVLFVVWVWCQLSDVCYDWRPTDMIVL